MTLGQRLKKLRNEKKWTLKEVAEKLKLSGHSTYSNWEYGRTEPDVEMLKNIAELYEVSIEHLMYGNEDNINSQEVQIVKEEQSGYNLEEVLKSKELTWGPEKLNEEEKQKAIQLLSILLGKQKDTI